MKNKLRRLFLSCLIFTVCFFWLCHGPHFEGLTQYTALSFFTGLLCGVFWGMYLSAWLVVEMQKSQLTPHAADAKTAPLM